MQPAHTTPFSFILNTLIRIGKGVVDCIPTFFIALS